MVAQEQRNTAATGLQCSFSLQAYYYKKHITDWLDAVMVSFF